MLKKLRNIFFPLLIIILVVILAWKNYIPGTILSGWDTLHPEFNFSLYLKRIFFGVWQFHQGVGAVASQAHISELPRLLILYLSSLVLPTNFVRYFFFFLTLVIGPLGVYFLTKYLLSREKTKYVAPAAFSAAIFYLFNLATLQHYIVPLEMFAVHFATFPWLMLLTIRYLREGGKKNLLWFSLVNLFAAAVAHTATLFYVYFGLLLVFLVTVYALVRKTYVFKRGIAIVVITLALNSFWLLPNLYFVSNHAPEVENSKISQIFSNEAFLQSKAFGDIKSLGLLKNFLFNWRAFDTQTNSFFDLMTPWSNHLTKPGVTYIGYGLFLFSLLGVIVALVRKSKYALAFIPLFLISVFFWFTTNPPFGGVIEYLRNNYSILREALRFPFTKFSIILITGLSLYLGYFVHFLIEKLQKVKIGYLVFVLLTAANIYFMWPALKGQFISPIEKVKIPNEYFQVFEWFGRQDPTARMAKLPLQTFWGWNFYSWNYQGAGFTWFGIPQPTFDREFDRWSGFNETFYNQASFALYNKDRIEFEKVLKKFQVKYLLLDESVINAGGNSNLLFVPEIKSLLTASQYITKSVSFGFLTVYEANWEIGKDFVSVPKAYVGLNSDTLYSKVDPLYTKYGDYFQDEKGLGYPFVNLDIRRQVVITGDNNNFTFTNKTKNASVTLPLKDVVSEDLTHNRGFTEAVNCDIGKIGAVTKENGKEGIIYTATGGGVSCDFLPYPDFKYSQGYVLHVQGRNITGRSLKIYLQNSQTGRMDLEELLPEGVFNVYYPILPQKLPGQGYTLNLETRSFGNVASENILEKVEFIPFSFDFLTGLIQRGEKESIPVENKLTVIEQKQIMPYVWKITTKGEGLLQLGQGYEKGWLAFGGKVAKKNLLTHVQVNGWANGWFVPNGVSTVYIFFWPQGLKWLGMILAIL
jgi:hypothetical protein